MADERIKLMLDMGVSAETAERVAKALDKVAASAKGAADSYEVLDRTTGTYTVSAGHLQTAMDAQVRKAVEQTQAQKAMNLILEETARAQVTVGTAATATIGGHGRGLLGMSYAFQDFSSVLSGGGGLARAMGAVSNNIDQIAVAAGATIKQAAALSIGFTALTAVMPLVTPLAEALWKALAGGGAGPEPVVKAVDAIEARLAKIRAELEKIMKLQPFEEKETQGRIEAYFAEVGPEKLLADTARAIGATGRGAKMTEQEAGEIRRQEEILASGTLTGQERLNVQDRINRLREAAQKRISGIDTEAAGKLIGQAPTSAAARRGLIGLAGQAPTMFPRGFGGELAELEPEAVARQEEEVAAAEEEGKRLRDAMKSRREVEAVNREAPELMKGPVEQFRRQQTEQLKAGRDTMQEATDEFRDLQRQTTQEARQTAQEARALEREAMAAAAPEVTQRQRATKLAGQAVMSLPETLPQMLGPQLGGQMAAVAQQANPAEIQAMKQEAMRNIMSGQTGEMAAYNALREVYEASIRTAQRNQQFAERMQSTPWPTGLPR
jgi:hypothetical protein